MKKIFFLSLILLISVSTFSQFKFKGVGAGLALGSKAAIDDDGAEKMGFGINVNALAGIMDKIDAEVSFSYYLPSEPIDGFSYQIMTISVNGHYNFMEADGITAYGLAGLNLGMAKAEISFMGISASESETKMGFNIGAGGAYALSDMLDLTAQIGYTAGGADQLFINVGAMYKF